MRNSTGWQAKPVFLVASWLTPTCLEPAKEKGTVAAPCRASSHRTGREKAASLFHRMVRPNDRPLTRPPSCSVSTCRTKCKQP